jgi:hypothetical protein
MTKPSVYTDEVLRSFAEMAVDHPESFEVVAATLPDDVTEKISAAVLVIESEKAATVLEKFLLPESDRDDDFNVAAVINHANDLAAAMRTTIKLSTVQGRGESMKRKIVFPTRSGSISVTLG